MIDWNFLSKKKVKRISKSHSQKKSSKRNRARKGQDTCFSTSDVCFCWETVEFRSGNTAYKQSIVFFR